MEKAARKARPAVNLEAAEGLSSVAGAERRILANESNLQRPSFEDVFLQYYDRIVGVLFRLMGDRARAEELASEVFLKLYRNPLPARPDGNLGGWLYRTATNLGIDAVRAANRRRHYEQEAGRGSVPTGGTPNPLDEVLRDETRQRVRTVLAALRPAQAQILILRSSGLSYNELAESLGVQRGSVGTMLARAEAEFQRRYLDMFGEKEAL